MSSSSLSSNLDPTQVGTEFLREVGARIAYVRGQSPQSKFADDVRIHKNTLGNYERGDREIGALALARFMALGWSANWLLTGEGPERLEGASGADGNLPSQDLSAEDLSIALELTEEALRGKWLPKRQYAEVVAGIYAMLTQGLPYADILDLTRPSKETKAKQGVEDGSRSEGDPAGEGVDRHRRAGGNG